MKRSKNNNGAIGCLLVIVVVALVYVGGRDVGRTGRATVEQTSPPLQEQTSHPLLEERGVETLTPLESEVAGLAGVREVGVVISTGGIVYMEITVQDGYQHQAFAEALLGLARLRGTVNDFSAVLNDGGVPISYLWRNGVWQGEPPLVQQATLISATQPGATERPYVPPIPTLPIVSPYTCNQLDDLNCSDFSDRRQAQAHMLMCGDEDDLDGNENGEACE